MPAQTTLDVSGPEVKFSAASTKEFQTALLTSLRDLIPWRKGPFDLYNNYLDAEWRSELKFDRLGLRELAGKRVADVGAGNGYYMFKLLGLNPELVVGFDPTSRYLVQYSLLKSLLTTPHRLAYVLERDSILKKFDRFFDLILCLGVFYHHPQPQELLENLFSSGRPGSEIYLETLYFKSKSLRLDGKDRYAKMKNVYLIPTLIELKEMLVKTGFEQVNIVSEVETSEQEQRTTRFAPGESLKEFISAANSALTVEGHPRPQRVILKALRP